MASPRFDRSVTIVLLVVIVAMAGLVWRRELIKNPPPPPVVPPQYTPGWDSVLTVATAMGSKDAPIRIIEFADLQCPACRAYRSVLDQVVHEFGNEIAIYFVHFPLSYHPAAYSAARAAECARSEGRFKVFVDRVFNDQDSLGSLPWVVLAERAGVRNLNAFSRCEADTTPVMAVDKGLAIGKQLGIDATPTILVEGWRFPSVPGPQVLINFINELRSGHRPVPQTSEDALIPERRDDHGIVRLEFRADAFERARKFELAPEPLATMGGIAVDPEFDLSDARVFALFSDGGLAALAPFGSRLLIFGPGGSPRRKVAREGEGPNELRGIPAMVRVDGDTLLVPDYGNMRMNWVVEQGKIVRTVSLRGRIGTRFNYIAGIMPDRSIVLYSSGRLTDGEMNRIQRQAADVALLPSGDTARIVAAVPDVESERVTTHYEGMTGSEVVAIGFSREAKVAVWDSRFVTAPGEGYRLEIRDATGVIRRTIDVDTPRRAVTARMRQAKVTYWLNQLHGYKEKPRDLAESERLIREAPYADSLPPYSALHVTPDHTLWVVDPIIPGDSAWSATAFHPDGTMVGRLIAHTGSAPVAFGDSVVAVRSVDSDGVVTIETRRFRARTAG